jgi:ATP-dependent Lhr-like helicase
MEWCNRRLLARIHRYTQNRLRAEIAPVAPAEFMRFLFTWQHADTTAALIGADGLRAVLAQLDGVELPARAWERDVLPVRVEGYDPAMLDMLCLTGEIGWARLSSGPTQVVGATPIALFLRDHAGLWDRLRTPAEAATGVTLSIEAAAILDRLLTRGASFGHELVAACGLDNERYRRAAAELVAAGLITSDGFAGLRSIIGTTPGRAPGRLAGTDSSGRWSATRNAQSSRPSPQGGITAPTLDAETGQRARASIAAAERREQEQAREEAVTALAWTLLRRYGVIFRRVVARETFDVPWRELARVYRRLEGRGDIRGGRFVSGMSGEQFALPDAVQQLRETRRTGASGRLVTISAADPLNLTGIITPGDRIRAIAGNRVVYRDGVPVATMEGDMLRTLADLEPAIGSDIAAAAAGRRVPVLSGYVGRVEHR